MFGFSWRPTCFGLKTSFLSLGFPWISLDFLGFSRPNRDFSMGYAGFSWEEFFGPPFPTAPRGAATGAAVEAIRKRGIVHAASLPGLLIFCKQLLSEPSGLAPQL